MEETGDGSVPVPPDLSNAEYWTRDVMNAQMSNFFQMAGVLIAVEMAHHHLGFYDKYAGRLSTADGEIAPILRYLTADEWNASLEAGVRNSLMMGYGIDGVNVLFEAIDRMPRRPAWTDHFLPRDVRIRSVQRRLSRLERRMLN